MRRSTYTLVLSDGKKINHDAGSAAEAVQWGLENYLGRTVAECFSGQEWGGKGTTAGKTNYDIPPHTALNEAPPQGTQKAA